MLNHQKYKLNAFLFSDDESDKYADLNAYVKIVCLYFIIGFEGHDNPWANREWYYLLTRHKILQDDCNSTTVDDVVMNLQKLDGEPSFNARWMMRSLL
jgi:hypothetical protein